MKLRTSKPIVNKHENAVVWLIYNLYNKKLFLLQWTVTGAQSFYNSFSDFILVGGKLILNIPVT